MSLTATWEACLEILLISYFDQSKAITYELTLMQHVSVYPNIKYVNLVTSSRMDYISGNSICQAIFVAV